MRILKLSAFICTCLKRRQIKECDDKAHDLADNRRPRRTGHAPVKDENENRVQDAVDNSADHHEKHGKGRRTVRPAKLGNAVADK